MERKSVPRSPQEVLVLCREHDVKAIDLKFTDLIGQWHHMTVPVSRLAEQSFEDGFGYNGTGMRGWQSPSGYDILLVPLPETACIDPFTSMPTLSMVCATFDPITREEFGPDPRHLARRAEHYLTSLGIADTAFIGPEVEFFIFDDVQFDQSEGEAFYRIDSSEAQWSRGTHEGPNLGHKIRHQEGYSPCPPLDQFVDIRTEMMQTLIECGVDAKCHHHEIGTAGQAQINFRHSNLVKAADNVMMYKYIVKNVVRRHGKTATFMPQPLMGDHGSGMHTHLSLWKGGEPLFAGKSYAGLSDVGLNALGGILKHTPALLAFTNPTTNSYRRLAPCNGAPTQITYSQRIRTAACRIPMLSPSPKSKRIEFRCPDPSCNPYLGFAAILMAAIDGVQNKIHPGEPFDRDTLEIAPEITRTAAETPNSLSTALDALQSDYDFLLRGDVFSEEMVFNWINYKRRHDVDPIRSRPHPYEFCMYFDV